MQVEHTADCLFDSMVTSWNGRAAHADTLGLGELACNPRVTLVPSMAYDDVRVGG